MIQRPSPVGPGRSGLPPADPTWAGFTVPVPRDGQQPVAVSSLPLPGWPRTGETGCGKRGHK